MEFTAELMAQAFCVIWIFSTYVLEFGTMHWAQSLWPVGRILGLFVMLGLGSILFYRLVVVFYIQLMV